jgi:hypothetical protein
MDLHIDKKVGVLLIIALLVGGAIGGAVGFVAGGEEGHGDRGGYEMNDKGDNAQFDNHADGETNDDQGGTPNQDEQKPATSGIQTVPTAPTTAPVPAQ